MSAQISAFYDLLSHSFPNMALKWHRKLTTFENFTFPGASLFLSILSSPSMVIKVSHLFQGCPLTFQLYLKLMDNNVLISLSFFHVISGPQDGHTILCSEELWLMVLFSVAFSKCVSYDSLLCPFCSPSTVLLIVLNLFSTFRSFFFFYCNICFILVVCNQTHNISKVCLYIVILSSTFEKQYREIQ